MESYQLKNHSSVEQQRRTKFTPQNIRQIINLVERGTSPEQIADIIGVTLGTLRVTCSKLQISLRRPSYDTGTGLLRHRPRRGGNSDASKDSLKSRTHADVSRESPVGALESHPMEQEQTLTPQDKASTDHGQLATFAIVMQYKGEKHAADLPLTQNMIGRLAIEAEFRGMKLVELIARAIESITKEDHFDLVLGSPKRGKSE